MGGLATGATFPMISVDFPCSTTSQNYDLAAPFKLEKTCRSDFKDVRFSDSRMNLERHLVELWMVHHVLRVLSETLDFS